MCSKLVSRVLLLALLKVLTLNLVQGEMNCSVERRKATHFATSCCLPTKPNLDPGYKECAQELKLQTTHRKLTMSERLGVNICIEECNYIGNGYVDANPPYVLDMGNIEQNIRKFIPKNYGTIGIEFLLKAYKICEEFRKKHKHVLDIKFPDIDIIDHVCSPYAMQITVCVRIYGMQQCPNEFAVYSNECLEARDYFKKCLAPVKKEEATTKKPKGTTQLIDN